jgi:hypothetical protein
MDVRIEEHKQSSQRSVNKQQLLEFAKPHAQTISWQYRYEKGAKHGQRILR